MEKQLVWACKSGRVESMGISKAGQTVLARLIQSQIWHQSASSVREGTRKRTIASAHLDARYLSLPLHTTGAPQVATPVPEPRGRECELLSLCVGSLRETAWGSRNFFHQLNPCWVLQSEVVVSFLPGTGSLRWGAWCGAGTPRPRDIPPKFLSTTHR